jgi:hypothetical protein
MISFAYRMAKTASIPKDRRFSAVLWDSLIISLNTATAQLSWADWRVLGRKLIYQTRGSSSCNTHVNRHSKHLVITPHESKKNGQMLTLVWKI